MRLAGDGYISLESDIQSIDIVEAA
jgi:hypothetical protein